MDKKAHKLSQEELNCQLDYCDKVKAHVTALLGRQGVAYVDTYGCQQNFADSELLMGMLTDMGFALTTKEQEADIAIFNTCAIREHAEMRVLGNVGKLKQLKKDKPHLVIAMCGCMAQQEHVKETVWKSYPYVDLLFGTHALYRFPQLLHRQLTTKKRVFDTAGEEQGQIPEGISIVRDRGIRANLPIMYGCNNFCTYCVVPYVRGRERSRDKEDIFAAFQDIVSAGYKEITLLGQNVNSYGSDKGYSYDFADLLEELAQVPGDYIIRFMTSHPKDATEKLFAVMAKYPRIAKQLHLPVQSGCNRVLDAMNRRYTKEHYLNLVSMARTHMPNLAFSTDIIVGFPGETEEEFEETLSLVEQVRYQQLFTFIFSPRAGTQAALMDDPVPYVQKQQGLDRLVQNQMEIALAHNTAQIGKTMRVLVDGESSDGEYPLSTHTEGGALAKVKGSTELIGQFIQITITKASPHALFGEAIC